MSRDGETADVPAARLSAGSSAQLKERRRPEDGPVVPELARQLRRRTRPEHLRLERRLGLPGSLREPVDVVELLVLFRQAWYAATAGISPAQPAGHELRSAAAHTQRLIAADLEALSCRGFAAAAPGWPQPRGAGEADLDGPMPAGPTPGAPSEPLIWGRLYVLLGSRLGAVVVARALAGRLAAEAGNLRFLRSDGVDVAASWSQFLSRLGDWAADHPTTDHEEVLVSARATFAAIDELAVTAGWDGLPPRRSGRLPALPIEG